MNTTTYVVVNEVLFKINSNKLVNMSEMAVLLVIPENYEPIIINLFHVSLLEGHQAPMNKFQQTLSTRPRACKVTCMS